MNCGDIILDRNYRRYRKDFWLIETQNNLIESLMIRIPINTFCFEAMKNVKYVVVDGWNRLNTIESFMNSKIELCNMEHMNKYEGYLYSELPSYIKRRIKESNISVYIISLNTPENIKNNIVKRICG